MKKSSRLLIVASDAASEILDLLSRSGDEFLIEVKGRCADFRSSIADLILLAEDAPETVSPATIALLHGQHPHTPIMVFVHQERVAQAVELIRAGATDYLKLPQSPQVMLALLKLYLPEPLP